MNTEQKAGGKIVLNTPLGLNLDLLFADLSIKFKPKAEFIIHQINYYHKDGGYQVHSKNHCWFFGIKGSELALIINRLIDSGIITKARNYYPGNTSNVYRMVQSFDIATSQKSFYHPDELLFIKKWAADGFIVKSAATSKFVKPNSTKSTIASQQKEIEELKALLFEVLGKLNVTVPTSLPIGNREVLAVSDFSSSIDLTLSDGQLGIQSPTIDLPMKADLITIAEGLTTPQSVLDNATLTDFSAKNIEDLNELLSVFNGDERLHTEEKARLSPMAEIISTTNQYDKINDELIEQALGSDAKLESIGTTEIEVDLTDTVEMFPYEDTMCISYRDKAGCIVNYQEIETWCSLMSDVAKQDFYYQLLTAEGKISNIQVNKHTKFQFLRKEIPEGFEFTYQKMIAA
ncbi:hypothetical protein FPZ43_05880 [Mucilaginibacter pallidiroseus]|uniref:Uncharacterized protein n=1 Tax=Mucilaginibacter pallidiroseus TaxID=2599295 RepID=A0A563UGR0_9SPHI|nr:hypothetical protein [Mucilaginibacter pallidiroseus]TWR30468.1 hypothetical protein FPZ43_05880 [Mucilaginibacter pallidiroseus]